MTETKRRIKSVSITLLVEIVVLYSISFLITGILFYYVPGGDVLKGDLAVHIRYLGEMALALSIFAGIPFRLSTLAATKLRGSIA